MPACFANLDGDDHSNHDNEVGDGDDGDDGIDDDDMIFECVCLLLAAPTLMVMTMRAMMTMSCFLMCLPATCLLLCQP